MVAWLLSPLAWLLLAAVSLLCWSVFGRGRAWLLASALVLLVSVAGMTPLVANLLSAPLERPMPVPQSCRDSPPTTAMVLAGGALGHPTHSADYSVLNLASRRRMDRAVGWWREHEGRALVLVGGGGHDDSPALANLMATYAMALGVPPRALHLETDSLDTWENARNSARLEPPLPRRIVLVTSAMHMPRAQFAFAEAGFEVCPLHGDVRRLPSRLPWALVPRSSGLERAEAALHEWVGLTYYRLRAQ
ncbi:MAG: YdcF family protein [Pseudomonadota bacterium]|nr:YdcF family protein [Pseudomonadota bacterium]